jgi:hypothetical protein
MNLDDPNRIPAEKPPLGLMPRDTWISMRRIELARAISRYVEAGKDGDQLVKVWANELANLIAP